MRPTQLRWWDEESAQAPCAQPATACKPIDRAIDALAIAVLRQAEPGAHAAIAGQLDQLCLELKRNCGCLVTALRVRDALERLDRDRCEPAIWRHLATAESAVNAHLAALRGG